MCTTQVLSPFPARGFPRFVIFLSYLHDMRCAEIARDYDRDKGMWGETDEKIWKIMPRLFPPAILKFS